MEEEIRKLIEEWRAVADNPDSYQEAMEGDVIGMCADELEAVLDKQLASRGTA